MRTCPRCQKSKPDHEFPTRKYTPCKECGKEWARRWRESGGHHNAYLMRKYGISLEDYNQMFSMQQGCCAICGVHQSEQEHRLHVDHDHATGRVRGLLCNNCNRGIGHLKDSPDILHSAIAYLQS